MLDMGTYNKVLLHFSFNKTTCITKISSFKYINK